MPRFLCFLLVFAGAVTARPADTPPAERALSGPDFRLRGKIRTEEFTANLGAPAPVSPPAAASPPVVQPK